MIIAIILIGVLAVITSFMSISNYRLINDIEMNDIHLKKDVSRLEREVIDYRESITRIDTLDAQVEELANPSDIVPRDRVSVYVDENTRAFHGMVINTYISNGIRYFDVLGDTHGYVTMDLKRDNIKKLNEDEDTVK